MQSITQDDRRTDLRLLCADMIEIEWSGARGELRIATALLEDISPLGLCLQMETQIPVDAVVLVNLEGNLTRARVRYCYWREIGYFAGLTFEAGARWSCDQFRPQHLTNPLDFTDATMQPDV